MRMRPLVPIALLVGLAAAPARADDLAVPRAAAALVLDGALDEADWAAGAEALEAGALEDGTRPRVRAPRVGGSPLDRPAGRGGAGPRCRPGADGRVRGYGDRRRRAGRRLRAAERARAALGGPRAAGRRPRRPTGSRAPWTSAIRRAGRWRSRCRSRTWASRLPTFPCGSPWSSQTRAPAHVVWAPPGAAWRGTVVVDAPRADRRVAAGRYRRRRRARSPRRIASTTTGCTRGRSSRPRTRRASRISCRPRGTRPTRAAPDDKDAVLDTLRQLLVATSRADPRAAPGSRVRARRPRRRAPPDGSRRRGPAAFERALEIMPGLGEARFGVHLELVGPSLAVGTGRGADGLSRRLRGRRPLAAAPEGYAAEGVAFGTGLLHLAHGDFAEALALLEPLADRYPFQQSLVYAASRARLGLDRWPLEERYRQIEAEQRRSPARPPGDLEGRDRPRAVRGRREQHGEELRVARAGTASTTAPPWTGRCPSSSRRWGPATRAGPWPPSARPIASASEAGEARRRLPWRGTVVMLSATPGRGRRPLRPAHGDGAGPGERPDPVRPGARGPGGGGCPRGRRSDREGRPWCAPGRAPSTGR